MLDQIPNEEHMVAQVLASGFHQSSDRVVCKRRRKDSCQNLAPSPAQAVESTSIMNQASMHPMLMNGWKPLCSVVCNGVYGEFLGGHDRDMFVRATSLDGQVMPCSQFEREGGRALSKKWKESLHVISSSLKNNRSSSSDCFETERKQTLLLWLKQHAREDFGEAVINKMVWIRRMLGGNFRSLEWSPARIVAFNPNTGKHSVQYLNSPARIIQELHLPAEQLCFRSRPPMDSSDICSAKVSDVNALASPENITVSQIDGALPYATRRASSTKAKLPRGHIIGSDVDMEGIDTSRAQQHLQPTPKIDQLCHQGSGVSISSTSISEEFERNPNVERILGEKYAYERVGGNDTKHFLLKTLREQLTTDTVGDDRVRTETGTDAAWHPKEGRRDTVDVAKMPKTVISSFETLSPLAMVCETLGDDVADADMWRQMVSREQADAGMERRKVDVHASAGCELSPDTPHQDPSESENLVEETAKETAAGDADPVGSCNHLPYPPCPDVCCDWIGLSCEDRRRAVDWMHDIASTLEREYELENDPVDATKAVIDLHDGMGVINPFARFHAHIALLHGYEATLGGIFWMLYHQFSYWSKTDSSRLKDKLRLAISAIVEEAGLARRRTRRGQ